FTKSIASNGATEYINCVIANAKNHEKANLIEALRSHSHVFTNSTLGKDRTSSDAFTGKFTTAYLTPSYGSFYAVFRNSEVYNFDVVIDNSAYPNGVSTKSVLVSNTKNVNYPNTKTIISGVNTDGRLYGTSVLPYATTVEIFETNGTGIDAVKYVGSVALETGQGPKTWVYIPGGDNMDLLPGKNYIAISSTALYSGEFSDPYTLACANLVVNTDQYKTDGKGNTYDNVFVVTRTDDYDATGLTAEQQNNCQYIGTLRWALNTAARFNTVKTRIVFAESLKNQTIKILPGDLKLEGDNITVDGTTISGYSSSEAPLINIDFQYQSSFNNIYNYYIGSLPGKYTNIKGLNLLNGGKLNSFIHYMSQNNFLAEHVCFMFEDKPGYSPSDTFTVFMGIQGLSSNESLNFKNCVFGSDYKRTRTDLKPLSGFAKQDGGDLSQRRFIDCKFYGFPKASLNGANNKNLVTKSLFIGNKKNIENPGFKSSIFLNNQDGSVQLGTVNPAGVKMEIYRTDETNVNAVEYMGSTSAYNNDMYAYDNASYYRFTYTPNDTNKALLPNQNYIVVSSTLSTTGEFSIPFTYSKPRVCLVTRTQDDYLEGSLRWALGCAMRQGTVDTVKFAIPTADTAVITLNTNWTYQDGDGVIIDGYSQSGTYARKVHIIGSPSHGHLEFIMAHATIKGLIFTDCKILWQYSWDCVFQGNQMNWRPATYTTLGFRTQRWCNGNRFNGNVFNGKFYLSVLDVTSMLVKGNTFLNGARSTFVRCENIKYISNTSLNPNNSFGTLSLSRSSSCLADSNVLEKGTIFVSGSDNIVTNNYLYGAWTNTSGPLSVYGVSTSAADNNYLANNIIDNYGTGIGLQIIGNAKFNTASKNIIYNVAVNGIALDTGSNMKVKAPELKLLGVSNPDSVDVEITARRNGIIEIFKGNGKLNEATEYIRSVFIDSPVAENEIRTVTARVPKNLLGSSKQYIIATLTDLQKNTSQFSNVLSSFSDGICVISDTTDKDISGSLRAAIRCANFSNNGKPTISFAIPGNYPKEIKLKTGLPKVENIFGDSVFIDGLSQQRYSQSASDTVLIKGNYSDISGNAWGTNEFTTSHLQGVIFKNAGTLYYSKGGLLDNVKIHNTKMYYKDGDIYQIRTSRFDSVILNFIASTYPRRMNISDSRFLHHNATYGSIKVDSLIISNSDFFEGTNERFLFMSEAKINDIRSSNFAGQIGIYQANNTRLYKNKINVKEGFNNNGDNFLYSKSLEIVDNDMGGRAGYYLEGNDVIINKNRFGGSLTDNFKFLIEKS
ncbi:MAG: hypothetical protein H7296_12705, partial [Bacteroidia bacterium]|nr:hypothetical protein [Bacteroidia bacterium]